MIIFKIFLPSMIMKSEVFMGFSVKEPKITHLHRSGTLAFNRVIDNPNYGGVVNVNRCCWLTLY